MSYEGHIQCLCSKGHLTEIDCRDEDQVCDCGEKFDFFNDVDDTNCEGNGKLHFDKHFLLSAAKLEVCDKGHQHEVEPAVYRYPTDEEVENLFTYYEWKGNEGKGKFVYYYCKTRLPVK